MRRGILDHDATVLELLRRRTFSFWARASTLQSVTLPLFDTRDVTSAVVSLAIAEVSGFTTGSRVRLWVENAVQTADEPSVVFAATALSFQIQSTTVPPTLQTAAWPVLGPGGRLRVEWQQGSTENNFVPATVTFAVFLTLRRG